MRSKHAAGVFVAATISLASISALHGREAQGSSAATSSEASIPTNPSEEQRIASFASASQPPQFLVTFSRPLQENQIEGLLTRAGARPFKVFMFLEGLAGFHTVAPSEADVGILTEARRVSAQQVQDVESGYRQQLGQIASRDDADVDEATLEMTRDTLRRAEQNERMANGFRTGVPVTYAVAVVAPANAVQQLRGSNLVSSVQAGYRLSNGRVVLPVPDLPAGRKTFYESPRLRGLGRTEILQEARSKGGRP